MIKVTNVSLRRGGELLFEDVSFSIYPGHRVGVTGANGVCKTSLFKLLYMIFTLKPTKEMLARQYLSKKQQEC